MTARTCRVGFHGRNDLIYHDIDYQKIRTARAEVIKTMSHTEPEYIRRIKEAGLDIEIITR